MNAVKVDDTRRVRLPMLAPGDYYVPEPMGENSILLHKVPPPRRHMTQAEVLAAIDSKNSSCGGLSTFFRPNGENSRAGSRRRTPPSRCAVLSRKGMSRFPSGRTRRASNGVSFEPLYKTAPIAALRDPSFYAYLALADALRDSRVRERKIAEKELCRRLREANERTQS